MDELASHVSEHIGRYFESHQARLETLASDRPPTILFIGCIDARMIPELMLNVDPGDMMTIRVPGALVPPQGLGDVCVAGSVELVLSGLSSIRHIVVCGHTSCAFNARLAEGVDSYHLSHLARWMAMADFARAQANTRADKNTDPDGYQQTLLEFTVQRSLQSLRELEIVKHSEKSGDITLHGWYFNMTSGQIMVLNQTSGVFESANQMTVEESTVVATQPAAESVADTQSQSIPPEMAQQPTSPQQVEQSQSEVPPVSIPSVAPPPVAAAHQVTPIDAKAPAPVNVPSAKPIERVYASEVSRAPSPTKSVATQSPSKPAQRSSSSQRPPSPQRPTPPERPTRPPRPKQAKPPASRTQAASGKGDDPLQQAADSVQAVLDQQSLRNLGELLQDVRRPAQRMRLRNMLNQVKSPQGWQTVRNAVSSVQNADVRQALRELSIELASPEARSELRGIISSLSDPSGATDNADMSKIEQDFMNILNNLRDKD